VPAAAGFGGLGTTGNQPVAHLAGSHSAGRDSPAKATPTPTPTRDATQGRVRSNPVAWSTSRVFLDLCPVVYLVECLRPHPHGFRSPVSPSSPALRATSAPNAMGEGSSSPRVFPATRAHRSARCPRRRVHRTILDRRSRPTTVPILGWIDPGDHPPGPLDPITLLKEQAVDRVRRTSRPGQTAWRLPARIGGPSPSWGGMVAAQPVADWLAVLVCPPPADVSQPRQTSRCQLSTCGARRR